MTGSSRRCRRCGVDKPSDRFEKRRATCRDCINAAVRARGRPTYRPERWRRYAYGLDAAAYDALVAAQRGRCAICGSSDVPLVIDHDHTTGRVRSLLCSPCNRGIGHLRDAATLCRAAAAYLVDPPGVPSSAER